MSEDSIPRSESSWLGVIALGFLGIGWVVAVLLGGGLELHRSAMAMPFIVVAGILGLVEAVRTGRSLRAPALVVGVVAMAYFIMRALSTEVWDLGRHDLHLVTAGWLTITTVAACAVTRKQQVVLLAVLIAVFSGHLLAGLYQQFVDAEFTFFRRTRHSTAGVSGLFWQWNNLAGLLAFLLPVFLGVALASRRWALRGSFLILVLAGVLLAYLTKSRAGFVAMVVGLGAVGGVVLFRAARGWRAEARLAAVSGFILVALATSAIVFMVASRLSEQRGQGADIERALGDSSRLGLAGLAFETWMESPFLGNGSQTFSYLAVRNWDPQSLPSWMGDPEVVHNEYMQMLTDYGALGLVVLMLFLAVSLISGLVGPRRERGSENSLQAGLRLGAIGGLAGGMAHAAIDFQPHLLPILMMAGMLVGVLLQSSGSSGWFRKGLQVCATLLALIFAVVAVAPESRATGAWLGWERKVIESPLGIDPGELPSLKRLVESSPHYSGARMYGRLQYRSFVETSELFRLEEARWGLSLALERHPYDPLSLINYSLVLDQLGEFEDALRIHRRAIEMTSGREDKYGAYGGLSQHLALRGQKLWMSREPEKALGCFLLSQQYLELSLRMRYKFGGKADYGARRQALKYAIKTLQDGKIQPEFPQDIKEPNSSRLD